MESLPVWKLFAVIFSLLALFLPLRLFLVRRFIFGQPVAYQSTRLLVVDFSLLVCAGLSTALFNHLVFDFSLLSGGKVAAGFAAIGFLPALDLSLRWEHGIIAAGKSDTLQSLPKSYSPQTRTFAVLAAIIILFAGVVLLLILWHDMKWLLSQDDGAFALPLLLRSVLWEILFVMAILLSLILLVISSYARNLKLLFANQTKVLESVSRGDLASKVPVVTNDEFAIIAGHTNVMIDHLRERERMARGLELASQIQANLLPRSSPHLPGIKIFGTSRFCDETGGDFYDYLVREEGEHGPELVIMIGDVTGHGVGSALLMTSVRAYLHAHIQESSDPARVMIHSNQLICRDVAGSGLVVTVFLLFYNPLSGLARWVGAGHHPALFLPSGDGRFVELAGSDIPLGIDTLWRYQASSTSLQAGLLYLGTDGIWEANDNTGRMFGKARLRQVLEENRPGEPELLVGRIFAEVDRFTGNAILADDRTAVIALLEARR